MRRSALTLLFLGLAYPATAQIRVDPLGVNVNAQGATTVFLTFGGLRPDQTPVEAFWCGELVPAPAPAIGMQCDPATLFGQLPLRYDRSLVQGPAFSDVMSIPPSVSRRAYQAAVEGQNSAFFYVRRFVSSSGCADEYVAVTCRLASGGARTPFALTEVELHFDVETPILYVRPGVTTPAFEAEIFYNGTGRLQGRWEIVAPGEEPPAERDLLTEATLPPEERGTQRRFAQLARFNEYLPPSGRFTLPGPDPWSPSDGGRGGVYDSAPDRGFERSRGGVQPRAGGGRRGRRSGRSCRGVSDARVAVRRHARRRERARGENWSFGGGFTGAGRGRDGASPERRSLPLVGGQPGVLLPARGSGSLEQSILGAVLPAGVLDYRSPPWVAERAMGGR